MSDSASSSSDAAAAQRHAVVVVGGGVAGLYTAHKLISAGTRDVRVLEGRPYVGGRVRTTRDSDKAPLFNDFAWRIGEDNTRMLALAEELGIALREQHTPASGAPAEPAPPEAAPGHAPLSKFAQAAVESAALADQRDRESGYAGRIGAVSFPGESHGTRHWFVEKGMHEYVTAIADLLPEGVVLTGHRVTDVTRDADSGVYRVATAQRDGTETVLEAETVVLAAPPASLRQFSVARQGLNPVLFAVHERRNGHIYAKVAPREGAPAGTVVPDSSEDASRIYRAVPDSLLQQVISGDYAGTGIFQAGYACDRFERVWRELQYQGPDTLKKHVAAQVDKLVAGAVPELKDLEVQEVFLRIGFVHRWQIEAHISGKDKQQLSRQALYPNPSTLPNLHLVGEAFSAHHGWTEGALQTAEDAAQIILANRAGDAARLADAVAPATRKRDPTQAPEGTRTMTYRGLVLDVTTFDQTHPGNAGPIKGYGNKDVSHIFDVVHPGWQNALATVYGLQEGTLGGPEAGK